jgi:hypothetical protein
MSSKKDKQGILLIGGVVVFVLSLLGYSAYVGTRPKPGTDNCIGHPDASTVIVIDRSEEISQQTLSEIRARAMMYVTDSVGDNERVSVFTAEKVSKNALAPLVSLCRPKRQGSRLTENLKSLENQFRAKYEIPLDSVLKMTPGTSTESPLAQVIIDLSLSHYLRSQKNTLIVFSDMLENTDRFSLYHCVAPQNVIADFRASRTGTKERPEFRNTMVRLNIIPRFDQARTSLECRDKLWVWFFGDDRGAHAGLDLDYLPGGQTARLRSTSNAR